MSLLKKLCTRTDDGGEKGEDKQDRMDVIGLVYVFFPSSVVIARRCRRVALKQILQIRTWCPALRGNIQVEGTRRCTQVG
jgi:hypothetical protein